MKKKTKPLPDVVTIDKYNLDNEWVRQEDLYIEYARALAFAERDVDDTKTELDLVAAELDLSIRENPESYKLPTSSEKSIASAILRQDVYQEALKALHKAQHRVRILKVAVARLDTRKKALESLVWLHAQSYFAKPQAPKGVVMSQSCSPKVRRKKKRSV